jgi:3'-phosphoadenosine 5'-phosphosulfate sulfotransferase (PAPS reductase)/FAD synthetase
MTSTLFPTEMPDLATYDLIVVNTSAGKDSQAMLHHLVGIARAAGLEDRLVAVHADLGRVEWEGTAELAEAQAQAYGVRFLKVSRPQGDLLQHIEDRGMFPSSAARYCTSDHKRGQVAKVLTMLTAELDHLGRQVRILNCMGLRAQESPARARKVPFENDKRATNGRRHVDTWLPILAWSVDQVWQTIAESGVPSHPAYAAGMPRLSCCFCVLASRGALVLAAQLNPGLAQEYVDLEARIGHTFQATTSMADIVAEAKAGLQVTVEDWNA